MELNGDHPSMSISNNCIATSPQSVYLLMLHNLGKQRELSYSEINNWIMFLGSMIVYYNYCARVRACAYLCMDDNSRRRQKDETGPSYTYLERVG